MNPELNPHYIPPETMKFDIVETVSPEKQAEVKEEMAEAGTEPEVEDQTNLNKAT